jgi:hypothetical protein
MEHLGMGRGQNFTDGQHDEEQTLAGSGDGTRWLKVAGGHAVILVARGGDGWTTCRWEFG